MIKIHDKKYPLNFNDLKKFITETKDIPKTGTDMCRLASKFVKETDQLSAMLDDLYPELGHPSIKARFTTIKNLLSPKIIETEKVSTSQPIARDEDQMELNEDQITESTENKSTTNWITDNEADNDQK